MYHWTSVANPGTCVGGGQRVESITGKVYYTIMLAESIVLCSYATQELNYWHI